MSQPELKPCPFCGEQPEVTKHFKRDEYCLVHRCEYIPAHIDFTTMAGILKRWNARADPASPIHPCIMQLDKLQSEPKLLTADELKAGGWWCADVSEDCANAFKSKHLRVFNSSEWGDCAEWNCLLDDDGDVTRGFSDSEYRKQIHRIGNEFYWGAASDQAN